MSQGALPSGQWFDHTDEMGLHYRAVLGTLGYDV